VTFAHPHNKLRVAAPTPEEAEAPGKPLEAKGGRISDVLKAFTVATQQAFVGAKEFGEDLSKFSQLAGVAAIPPNDLRRLRADLEAQKNVEMTAKLHEFGTLKRDTPKAMQEEFRRLAKARGWL
jgi:hypothetical protein